MELFTLLAIVVLSTSVLAYFAKKEGKYINNDSLVFRYTKLVRYLGPVSIIIFILLARIANSRGQINDVNDYIGWAIVFLISILFSLYFIRTEVILASHEIVKHTLFGKLRVPYSEVKKIVVYHSSWNPIVAMTRVYGNQTIVFESLLVGYQKLLDETISRCINATIIEKHR